MIAKTPHYIVGHRNPDLDSLACACVLAWMHRQLEPEAEVTPLRLGEASGQARWVFAEAGCELPNLRKSCLYRAGEIARPLPSVKPECPLGEALRTMQRAQTSYVAVVDADRRPIGIISDRSQRTNYLLQCNVEDFVGTLLRFEHIVSGLPLLPLKDRSAPHIESLGVPLHKSNLSGDWNERTALIIGDRELFLNTIKARPPGVVILTGVSMDRSRMIAGQLSCPVYRYDGTVIEMLTRLPGCFSADCAMEEDFATIGEQADEADIGRAIKRSAHGLTVVDEAGRISGTISPLDLLNLKRPRISLVDHSEQAQSIGGLGDAEVVEIIDHHRLGDVETIAPLHIDVRPLGSTASILFERIRDAELQVPGPIAKLLLAALVADTLLFTSPTCTEGDKERAKALAQLADVDLQTYGIEVLRQNDELATGEVEALVRRDCKRITSLGYSFLAAQIETVDLSNLSPEKAGAIDKALAEHRRAEAADFGALMITDVLRSRSRISIVADDPLWYEIHCPESKDHAHPAWIEEQFVSRKKQLIPFLIGNIRRSRNT